MRLNLITFCAIGTFVVFSLPVQAEDWLQWRGPFFNGSTTETNLPESWTTRENVAWVAEVPGDASSTPIIVGDRIFINALDSDMKLWAICLNRTTGETLWKRPVGEGYVYRNRNPATSSSPVTDGRYVYFLFGTGDLVAFTVEGAPLWDTNIQKRYGAFEINWQYGSSPLLYDGRLYVQVIHGNHRTDEPDKSYLLALNPLTGEELWKVDRHTSATYESKQAYSTPYPWIGPNGSQILILGADHLTGHDPATGKELWRSETYNPQNRRNGRIICSPVTVENTAFVAGPQRMSMYGLQINTEATNTPQSWAWSHNNNSPDVPTALAYKNRFYVLDGNRKLLLCLEPKSGDILGQCELGGSDVVWASPTGAGDKIYTINKNGEVAVLSATDNPQILYRVDMGGTNWGSSIAISHGQLFIRVKDQLYCIGKTG